MNLTSAGLGKLLIRNTEESRLHLAVRPHDRPPQSFFTFMSLTRSVAVLPLLWLCTTAVPAGPGWWPNGTSSDIFEGDFNAAAYGLIDTYDGTNWLSKFDVQAVSSCAIIPVVANNA
jgi:hypothetical protein